MRIRIQELQKCRSHADPDLKPFAKSCQFLYKFVLKIYIFLKCPSYFENTVRNSKVRPGFEILKNQFKDPDLLLIIFRGLLMLKAEDDSFSRCVVSHLLHLCTIRIRNNLIRIRIRLYGSIWIRIRLRIRVKIKLLNNAYLKKLHFEAFNIDFKYVNIYNLANCTFFFAKNILKRFGSGMIFRILTGSEISSADPAKSSVI